LDDTEREMDDLEPGTDDGHDEPRQACDDLRETLEGLEQVFRPKTHPGAGSTPTAPTTKTRHELQAN
jgi:hypothetical protein